MNESNRGLLLIWPSLPTTSFWRLVQVTAKNGLAKNVNVSTAECIGNGGLLIQKMAVECASTTIAVSPCQGLSMRSRNAVTAMVLAYLRCVDFD